MLLDLKVKIPLGRELYKEPYNPLRRCKIITFISCLCEHCEPKLTHSLAVDLESGTFEHCKTTGADYNHICFQIASLLDKSSDSYSEILIGKLKEEPAKAKKIGSMTVAEMVPDQYQYYVDLLTKKTTFQPEIKTTSLYRCPRCHHRECTLSNLYDRAADECTNITVKCVNCNHQWKA